MTQFTNHALIRSLIIYCYSLRNAINARCIQIKMKHWLHCGANTQIRGGSNAFTHNNNALNSQQPWNSTKWNWFCFFFSSLDRTNKIYWIRRLSRTNVKCLVKNETFLIWNIFRNWRFDEVYFSVVQFKIPDVGSLFCFQFEISESSHPRYAYYYMLSKLYERKKKQIQFRTKTTSVCVYIQFGGTISIQNTNS